LTSTVTSGSDPTGELSRGLTVTWAGMAVNILLAVIKTLAGIYGSSQALIADGVHSISDLFSDVIVILGLKWGRKQEDANHPFGHARIETVAGMVVGLVLLAAGFGLAYKAVSSVYHHQESSPGILAITAAAVSILLKEVMYRYTVVIGRRLKSLALIANAWHHRSDALSSVAVLVGVTAAYLEPSWHLADAFAALVVSVFIAKVGGGLIWLALKEMIDTAPGQDAIDELADTASRVEGVRQVHDMRARYSGSRIFVEIHIVVHPDLTVRAGHDIARKVKSRLLKDVTDVAHVIVHVDPELKRENP